MTRIVIHNHLPARDALRSGMRPLIYEISKANAPILNKPAGWYFDDGANQHGPYKLYSMAVEASRKETRMLAPGRAMVRRPAEDYIAGQSTWLADIERQNGSKETAHFTAASEEEARKRFETQFEHSKVSNVRKAQTSAPATKK